MDHNRLVKTSGPFQYLSTRNYISCKLSYGQQKRHVSFFASINFLKFRIWTRFVVTSSGSDYLTMTEQGQATR